MVTQPLVGKDAIDEGQRLLAEIDAANIRVTAALWLYLPDTSRWRFVIETPDLLTKGPRAIYLRIGKILRHGDYSTISPTSVGLLPPNDRVIAIIKRGIGPQRNGEPREYLQTIENGVVLHGAVVYRMRV